MIKEDGGPAFPIPVMIDKDHPRNISTFSGMSLRDYFAAKAMQGILSDPNVKDIQEFILNAPKQVYAVADAMLKERSKCPKS